MAGHQALFDRFIEIHNAAAWDRLDEVLAPDCVEEYPQSGEVFRGLEHVRAVRANYPGSFAPRHVDPDTARVAGNPDRWLVTPMFTAIRVQGDGDSATALFRVRYPDGSTWWNVHVCRVTNDRIVHSIALFAPVFDPPDWRAPYREALAPGARVG